MCGIFAVIGEYEKEKVKKAIALQEHRGPDDFGIYFDDKIALAHKRLAIIDLDKRAGQPMISEKGNLIVYNGEIYNFKEIKEEIEKLKSFKFKTKSDSEVILAAYECWGEQCVKKFNGMFSFIIWDKEKRQLFVARDRLGVKPLYYYKDGEKLIFSSEIKSILEFVKPEINKEKLYDYFNYFIQIGNETLFKGIKIFPRASYALINRTKTVVKEYWNFNYEEKELSEEQAKNELKKLLEESVKKRLVADVPVGSFLSGGLDSSLITSIMKKHSPDLKTFSVAYDIDNRENELAEETSKFIGTEHYSLRITAEDFKNALKEMIYKYDSPISFASSIPLYFVAKLTKEKVKVVLTGEGADELFAGYDRYWRIQKMLRLNKKIPKIAKKFIIGVSKIFSDPRYIKNLELIDSFNFDYLTGINVFIGEERDKILKLEKNDKLKKHIEELFKEKDTCFLNRILWTDLNSYLQELLTKQDRMSMAASIESRVPFLDYEIAEFASKIPRDMKLKEKTGKKILREIAKDYLPESIINRKKIGFTVPIDRWFKTSLKDYIEEQLASNILDEFFNREEINKLLEKNRKGKNVSLQLWALLNFKIWYEIFLEKKD